MYVVKGKKKMLPAQLLATQQKGFLCSMFLQCLLYILKKYMSINI